jgi:hydroxymethylbilane synthase
MMGLSPLKGKPMTKRHITIATRESPLALQQTGLVKKALQALHPHLSVDLLGITTVADKRLDVTLDKIGGKGLFVKELEEALMDGRADIAVHSVKDMPMDLPPGLIMPVICKREDPRDAFVSNDYASLAQLPLGASVGTSSIRRQTQIHALRPDITLHPLRGNVNTRLSKLDNGEFSAIVLAAAGLLRMGWHARIRSYFATDEIVPAAGQGALGIECRAEDQAIISLITSLNDPHTNACVTAERSLCRRLNGGCEIPIGSFAQLHHDRLTLHGLIASRDGRRIIRVRHSGESDHAESIGLRAAEELLQNGAEKILREFHESKT